MMVVTQAVITMKGRKLDVFNSGRAKEATQSEPKQAKPAEAMNTQIKGTYPT